MMKNQQPPEICSHYPQGKSIVYPGNLPWITIMDKLPRFCIIHQPVGPTRAALHPKIPAAQRFFRQLPSA